MNADAALEAQRVDYFRRMDARLNAEDHRRFLLAIGHVEGCAGLPCRCSPETIARSEAQCDEVPGGWGLWFAERGGA